ncbi:putative immunity protein [Saccharopolyspora halophila]
MAANGAPGSPVPRTPDFDLSMDEIRAVTAFNLACALRVIDLFEAAHPHDERPRQALAAAADFVRGGPRSRAQRSSAPAAHRAAKEVSPAASHAAMAAGDAAASAYVHPLADGAQVGHVLRGPAHTVLALQLGPVNPLARAEAEAAVLQDATATLVEVLRRYPRVSGRGRDIAEVMDALDARLRAGTSG